MLEVREWLNGRLVDHVDAAVGNQLHEIVDPRVGWRIHSYGAVDVVYGRCWWEVCNTLERAGVEAHVLFRPMPRRG